jgi:poly(hydroxyalkanoate) depolymerase family esterase
MRGLQDTIARLAAFRAMKVGHSPLAIDRLDDFGAFGSNPGKLVARTYIPEGLPRGAPLVVVLHGCTQSAAGYDHGSGWSHLADRHGFALLFPEQQRTNNPNLCFNWFNPADQRRGAGEALSIRQMIDAMHRKHGTDPARAFVTGLSAGGAMTAVMLAAYPELFAGGAIIAGLPYGCATTVPQAFDCMRGAPGLSDGQLTDLARSASRHQGPWPRLSVWHGGADQTVSPSNADAVVAQWRGLHGLPAQPSRSEKVDGALRRVWAADGKDLIESWSVPGMGHGTPLDTTGPDGCGAAGPFMLEAGISSTAHIAAFWGLSKAPAARVKNPRVGSDRPPPPAIRLPSLAAPARRQGADLAPQDKIRAVIENALRSAGLMR